MEYGILCRLIVSYMLARNCISINFRSVLLKSQNIKLNLLSLRFRLIELGFHDTSTLVGHFVSSPREREKRDRGDSRRDEREE